MHRVFAANAELWTAGNWSCAPIRGHNILCMEEQRATVTTQRVPRETTLSKPCTAYSSPFGLKLDRLSRSS